MMKLSRAWLFVVLLFPAAAIAAGGGGHHNEINWKELAFAGINFAIFLGGLIFLLRKPLRDFLQHRRETLRKNLEEAAEEHAEAADKLKDLEARLSSLDEEREKILAQYREEGEREKARLQENARRTAEAMRHEVGHLLEQHTKELQSEIRNRAVDAAMKIVRRVVVEQLTAQDRARLTDDYIEQLREAAPPS